MRSNSNEKEFYRPVNPSAVIMAQGCGVGQEYIPEAKYPLLEASALAIRQSDPDGGAERPDNNRIAQLSIGIGFITATGMSALASFERASMVFITSIAMLSLLAGAGFVYLSVKAILAAEYDFEH